MADHLHFGSGKGSGSGEQVRVLGAGAVREALARCAEDFCASGGEVSLQVDTSGGILARMAGGEVYDLIAAASEALDDLAHKGLLEGPLLVLGAARLAMGVRKGAVAPDISSIAAYKDALLGARCFVRGDPKGGGTGGRLIEDGLARIGVLDLTMEKTLLRVGGHNVMAAVADGSADFGLTQSTEIGPAPGVEIGGFLPEGVQVETIYVIAARTGASAGSRALLAHLASAAGRKRFEDAGFFAAG
jgi:molybdate transport system substrate-binding protein